MRRILESSFSGSAGHALVQLRVISSLSSNVLTVLNFPRDTNPQHRDRLDILLHYQHDTPSNGLTPLRGAGDQYVFGRKPRSALPNPTRLPSISNRSTNIDPNHAVAPDPSSPSKPSVVSASTKLVPHIIESHLRYILGCTFGISLG